MIIPVPTALHNQMDVINKVNGDALAGALGNNNKNLARIMTRTTTTTGMATATTTVVAAAAAVAAATATTATMATIAAAATTVKMGTMEVMVTVVTEMVAVAASAAANALTKVITAAAAAVTHVTSQKDLAHTMAEHARSIVEEALKCCTKVRTALEKAHCTRATTIDPIKIANADKIIEVVEVTVSKLERTATAKGNIPYVANAFAERACNEYHLAVNALKKSMIKQQKVLEELWGTVEAQCPLRE
jgi:hypothetical protein